MTMRELIVDGYNIIHAWPELSPLIRSGRVEEARHTPDHHARRVLGRHR